MSVLDEWIGHSKGQRSSCTLGQTLVFLLLRNATYCMKVSMSMTVEESDEGKCFSSNIRHLEKAEITHSKMITCPDIDDYLAPYKQPQMTWYKVRWSAETGEGRAEGRFSDAVCICQECDKVEWRSTIVANTTHVWIPEVEEGDGGNYTCELQYGSRLVRRTTQLKVTGRKRLRSLLAYLASLLSWQKDLVSVWSLEAPWSKPCVSFMMLCWSSCDQF